MATDTKFDEGFEEVPFDEGFEEVKLDDGFEEVPMETPEVSLREKAIMAQPSMPTAQDLTKNDMVSTIEPLKEGQMGPLEAAAISAAPSMTLGVSDVIAGAAGAAGHAYGSVMEGQGVPSGSELLDTYYEAKKGEGKRREKAMEDQTGASIAGMVGGGLLLTGAAGPVAGAISKYGKVGKLASNVLPNMKGFSDAARTAKLAKETKDMAGLYDTYKALRMSAVLKNGLTGVIEGGKAGGIMAGTMGEAELLKGELADTAKEIAIGTGTGALVGGGFSGLSSFGGVVGDIVPGSESMRRSFNLGKSGAEIKGKYVLSENKKLVKSFIKDMNNKFKELGANRDQLYENAKKLKTKVKTEQDVVDALEYLSQFDSSSFKKKSADFVDVLTEHLGKTKQMRKIEDIMVKKQAQMNQMSLGLDDVASTKLAKQQLNQALKKGKAATSVTEMNVDGKEFTNTNKIIKSRIQKLTSDTGKTKVNTADVTPISGTIRKGIDPETGLEFGAIKNSSTGKETVLVGSKPKPKLVDGESSIEDALIFQEEIKDYTSQFANDNVPSAVKNIANKLQKNLKDNIDEAVSNNTDNINLKQINKQFSALFDTFEGAGVKKNAINKLERHQQLSDMADFFVNTPDDKKTFSDLSFFLERLQVGAPEVAKKYSKDIKRIREIVDLSRGADYIPLGSSKLTNVVLGTLGGALNKVANLAGRMTRGPIAIKNAAVEQEAVKKVIGKVTSAASTAKSSIAKQTRRATEASPEKIRNLITKLAGSNNKSHESFKPVLEKLVEADGRKRAAIMFGLMQDPTFRDFYKDEEDNE